MEFDNRPLHEQYAPKELGNGIIQVPKEVKFYLTRLDDLAQLQKSIDRGDYPLAGYEGVPLLPGEVQKDNPDMQPTTYGKGLRYGASFALTGTRSMLSAMGYGKEADFILKMYRNTTREQQQQQQQEGRQ